MGADSVASQDSAKLEASKLASAKLEHFMALDGGAAGDRDCLDVATESGAARISDDRWWLGSFF